MGRDKDRDTPEADLGYAGGKVRLFVEAPLAAGAKVTPSEGQAHYLLHVMRSREGSRVLLFNGRHGEWRARIAEVTGRRCTLFCESQSAAQAGVPDLWLAFAPSTRAPVGYGGRKGAELAVSPRQPAISRRSWRRR